MKKFIKVAAISAVSLFSISAQANVLNGDFQTGDFSGWNVDSDGLGDPASSSDFSIANDAAQIKADYSDSQSFIVNTLHQDLDLSAKPTDKLVLSFNWKLTGDAQSMDEVFGVGLVPTGAVGYYDSSSTGFLFEQTGYGSGTFTAMLDASLVNQGGWMLEFQMLRGFDGSGSTLEIDNVSLQAVSAVPEPSEMMLFSLGLVVLYGVRRKSMI